MAEVDEKVRDSSSVTEETKAESAQDIESQIQRAMRSRVSHFKEQASSLTLEGVRRLMEKDLGLEAYALDVHKRFVKECLLECLNGGDEYYVPKSSAETVEKTIATAEEEATELPKKQQMKKDVKEANSENEGKREDSPVMGLLMGDKKTKTQTKENQSTRNKEVPSENMIKEAIRKRASYLKANSDNITMSGVRQLLEEDLKLEKNSLFPFKKFIAGKVDEVLSSPKAAQSKVGLKKKASEKISGRKVSKPISPEVSSDSSDGESEEVGLKSKKKPAPQRKIKKYVELKKRKRTSKGIEAPSKKQSKQAQASEESTGTDDVVNASEDDQSQSPVEKPAKSNEVVSPAYGKRVEHLKSIIKSCRMSVPPVVYKRVKQVTENKREAFLIKELEGILLKEGLSIDPSEKEIKEVKKRKEREKELEGIDMSNIVSSTRRRSTTSFAPPPKPKIPVESDSDEGEDTDSNDDDGEGDDDDDGDDNDNNEVSNEDGDNDSD